MSRWARPLVAYLSLCGLAFSFGPPGVWLDVPFVRQEKNACGAASIAMVMQYWKHHVDPDQIQSALYSRQSRGIRASDLERYLRHHGFQTFALEGAWKDLKEQLEKGRPPIVALKSGRKDLHYVVVTGLDWQQDIVLKNDPAERKLLKQHRSDFEREWKAAGNWTLLAVPRESSF